MTKLTLLDIDDLGPVTFTSMEKEELPDVVCIPSCWDIVPVDNCQELT